MLLLSHMETTQYTNVPEEELSQFYRSLQPIILEELGLGLIPSKSIASGSSTIFQSVFLRIEIPQFPKKPCNLDCAPDPGELKQLMIDGKDCWIEKLHQTNSTMIKYKARTAKLQCITLCIMETDNCGVISYDEVTSDCYIRLFAQVTTGHWQANALNDKLTTSSVQLSCLLEASKTTRSKVCKNVNPVHEALEIATTQF